MLKNGMSRIGLYGSAPQGLTNDRDTKREKMTSVCFGLP